jgi:D-alanyl-D-alanine carboxypeptidase
VEYADSRTKRGYIRERLRAGVASQSDRHRELLAVINGEQSRSSRAADLEWLIAAIDSHP